ncbi:hypothetical protein [Catellatospora sp. NPDC049609]|uniref:hypothetical protein n=1 Tax=Catellatospora sp. NPDC049609 TaxID=3155505 RepID=UPI00341E49F5
MSDEQHVDGYSPDASIMDEIAAYMRKEFDRVLGEPLRPSFYRDVLGVWPARLPQTLTGAMRRHHETGEYHGTHIRVSSATMDSLPRAAPRPAWAPNLDALLGLSVVIDDELPLGAWRLVDNRSGEVRLQGTSVGGGR